VRIDNPCNSVDIAIAGLLNEYHSTHCGKRPEQAALQVLVGNVNLSRIKGYSVILLVLHLGKRPKSLLGISSPVTDSHFPSSLLPSTLTNLPQLHLNLYQSKAQLNPNPNLTMSGLQESSASEGESWIGENSLTNLGARDEVNFIPAVACGMNSIADMPFTDLGACINQLSNRFDQLSNCFNQLSDHVESLARNIDILTLTMVALADTIRSNFTDVNGKLGEQTKRIAS